LPNKIANAWVVLLIDIEQRRKKREGAKPK
jgi:hypothetical protein